MAVGDSIESAIAAVMYHARTRVTATNTGAAEVVAETNPQGDIEPQWYENWYDGLGYCECEVCQVFGTHVDRSIRHLELPRTELDRGEGPEGAGHPC